MKKLNFRMLERVFKSAKFNSLLFRNIRSIMDKKMATMKKQFEVGKKKLLCKYCAAGDHCASSDGDEKKRLNPSYFHLPEYVKINAVTLQKAIESIRNAKKYNSEPRGNVYRAYNEAWKEKWEKMREENEKNPQDPVYMKVCCYCLQGKCQEFTEGLFHFPPNVQILRDDEYCNILTKILRQMEKQIGRKYVDVRKGDRDEPDEAKRKKPTRKIVRIMKSEEKKASSGEESESNDEKSDQEESAAPSLTLKSRDMKETKEPEKPVASPEAEKTDVSAPITVGDG